MADGWNAGGDGPAPGEGALIEVVIGSGSDSVAVRRVLAEAEVGRIARGDWVGGDPQPVRSGAETLAAAPFPRTRRPDHCGRITVQRRPCRAASAPRPLDLVIDIPATPGDPPALPWVAAGSSLVGGAVIAMLFSPVFAILAAVSALTVLARSLAGRRSVRRATKDRADAIDQGVIDVGRAIDRWRVEESERRHRLDRGPASDEVLGGAMPWQRELDPSGPLALRVGVGRIEVVAPDHRIDAAELLEHVPPSVELDDAPIDVCVNPGEGLAFFGDRADALAAMRSAVIDACAGLGPSSLGLVVVTTADRLCDWDWCKWLPQLVASAVGAREADAVLAEIGGFEEGRRRVDAPVDRPVLVLVDGVEPGGPGPLARLLAGRINAARLLWTGSAGDVPSACVSTVFATADDRIDVQSILGEPPMTGDAASIGLVAAERIARGLAAYEDPLLDESGQRLPAELVVGSIFDDESTRADAWRRADRQALRAVVGVDGDGVVELDLVSDGPHALVAGTTGAGKSEFLRTFILGAAWAQPPELVAFVLIDFKGGGAFDAVGGLPHVASVVTDLDAASAERALRALRAELRSREERLRELGVSDIADVPIRLGNEPLPRLVIAVDEFASLADELPEFLDELVDVARRGRSLGVHLVLATQRPAGVVTGQIRANTNLRVCLRVQDRSDSVDVIDRHDAALLPAIPGRAVVSRGGAVAHAQIARVSGVPTVADAVPFVLHPALFDATPGLAASHRRHIAGLGRSVEPSAATPPLTPPLTLGDRIEMCRSAASTRATPPWLEPIRSVDLEEVVEALGDRSTHTVPLGWLDDPDHRRRVPLAWDSSATGLLVVGAEREDVEATVHVALAGVLRRRPETHVFVFDGGGGLAGLESVAGVAAVVTPSEGERAVKALHRLRHAIAAEAPICVVVHRWSAVADALDAHAGLDARVMLERLVREGADRGVVSIATGADERDVPSRVASRLSARVIHRLATPTAYLALDVRPASAGELARRQIVEPTTNRLGMVGAVSLADIQALSQPRIAPDRVVVLGDRVDRASIAGFPGSGSASVVIGLDDDLDPASITWEPGRPVVILGLPGSGRTTAIGTLLAGSRSDEAVVIDDGECMVARDAESLVSEAREADRRLVVASTPASARGFGSWIAPLLETATVVLLNPTRSDGEACRVVVPDLRNAPRGRAVLCDRGRTSIVQVAA